MSRYPTTLFVLGCFVVKNDNNYTGYVFLENRFTNMYRKYAEFNYETTFTTAVCGRKNCFLLELIGEEIEVSIDSSVFVMGSVLVFLAIFISSSNIIYMLLTKGYDTPA